MQKFFLMFIRAISALATFGNPAVATGAVTPEEP